MQKANLAKCHTKDREPLLPIYLGLLHKLK